MYRVTCLLSIVFALLANPAVGTADELPPVYADQSSNWDNAARADFYTHDQGSRMIPLAWLQALKQANGQPFLGDHLARYGYLPNAANSDGLPVGFTTSGPPGAETVGMTCSACHTRQIVVEGKPLRIDGGPAIVDFQTLLADLDAAVGKVLSSDAAFAPFATIVLGTATPEAGDLATLRQEVDAWFARYHALMSVALPPTPWGPARLDAVGMILNRVAGLDLGPAPSFIIADNIKPADAPVRYPFLWNAPRQDKTQWPAFADNGSDILGLSRNLGEVLGVFAVFEPKREGLIVNFLNNNSANFDGLSKLEELVKRIGPPKWPGLIDTNLAAQGKAVYQRSTAAGGCADCHEIKSGKVRFPLAQTWATPMQNVGTDTREYDVLARTVKTAALQGAFIPFVTNPLKEEDLAISVLATSVVGSIGEQVLRGGGSSRPTLLASASGSAAPAATPSGAASPNLIRLPVPLRDLEGAFHSPAPPSPPGLPEFRIQGLPVPRPAVPTESPPQKGAYEARVLQGIWATAPYLHNGSVPTLAELLKPAAERISQFKIGPLYDMTNIGIAADQTQFTQTYVTTDCAALNSGNSRCGHEFGTKLSEPEKKALLEYLKTL